jgi:hypothetical protein
VVISVPERQTGQNYADVTAAVRALADSFDLRVVVDGSPNSIPPELFSTKRQIVIAVEPMSKEQIESIPELKVLIDFLKSRYLDEPVWKVLGGSPIDYLNLKGLVVKMLSQSDTASDEVVNRVKDHIQTVLFEALDKILNSSANTEAIIECFRKRKANKVPKAELKAMGFLLDYPNKVFREVDTMEGKLIVLEGKLIVPSSPAVSLIITENVQKGAGVCELRDKLFKAT